MLNNLGGNFALMVDNKMLKILL